MVKSLRGPNATGIVLAANQTAVTAAAPSELQATSLSQLTPLTSL